MRPHAILGWRKAVPQQRFVPAPITSVKTVQYRRQRADLKSAASFCNSYDVVVVSKYSEWAIPTRSLQYAAEPQLCAQMQPADKAL